jgi:4-amino-4-deoxy-L-arabinose transferase-like glycosyltransferase
MKLPRIPPALALALAVGAAYRLVSFVANPSLPVDDAMLALNVASRSYGGLLQPLDYGLTTPPLFLWALRLAADLGGVNEFALRALPLLAGLVLPLLVWRVARRLMDPGAALVAAWFVALSPILIMFSFVVKPYELDALMTLAVVGLALDVLERPNQPVGWWVLAAAGILAILASTPVVFVLAGVGAALVVALRGAPSAAQYGRLAAVGAVWVGVFVLTYAALYDDIARGAYMQQFWAAGFLGGGSPGSSDRAVELIARIPLQAFETPRVPALAALPFWALMIAGLVYLRRRHGLGVLLLFSVPLVAAIGASVAHRYPVSPRLFLFAAPLVILSLVAGLAAARERWPGRGAARVHSVVVTLWLLTLGGLALLRPYRGKSVRHVVADLARQQLGEPVYVYAGAVPAWAFYTTDWASPDTARLRFVASVAGPGGPAFHNAAGRGRPVAPDEGDGLWVCTGGRLELLGLRTGMQAREGSGFSQRGADTGWAEREAERIAAMAPDVWLVFANIYPTTLPDLQEALRQRGGEPTVTQEERGAALYRYRVVTGGSGREVRHCPATGR